MIKKLVLGILLGALLLVGSSPVFAGWYYAEEVWGPNNKGEQVITVLKSSNQTSQPAHYVSESVAYGVQRSVTGSGTFKVGAEGSFASVSAYAEASWNRTLGVTVQYTYTVNYASHWKAPGGYLETTLYAIKYAEQRNKKSWYDPWWGDPERHPEYDVIIRHEYWGGAHAALTAQSGITWD